MGGGMETCSRIFLCKICRVKGSALIPSPSWSQHRTGASAWYSLKRRAERAGAIREGFLEEGVGFRWRREGQSQAGPYSRPPPALSGLGPRCVLPCGGAPAAPLLCPQGWCSQRAVLAESGLPAATERSLGSSCWPQVKLPVRGPARPQIQASFPCGGDQAKPRSPRGTPGQARER